MKVKGKITLGLVALFVAIAAATGAVAAEEESSTTIIDESLTVDNETVDVWYEVVAVDDLEGDTLDATVTFEGLEEGQDAGNGTELATETIMIDTGGEAALGEYELVDTDADNYETIRVHIEGDTESDVDLVASSDYGITERVSGGGGGGFLSGGGSSTAVVAILVVLAAGIYMRD